MAAADELVDEVDDEGRPVRVVTRAEARAGNLLHRSVFIAVLTSRDEVVVHRRAPWKDIWPSYWDVCFGGVVDAGEPWEAAAARELAEEAGIEVSVGRLEPLGEGRYEDDRVRELSRSYLVHHDGPFTFPDGEVSAWELVPRRDLARWCGPGGRRLVLDAAQLMLPHLLDLGRAHA